MLYVALLRGINVGGHRRVPMQELREALTALPFRNVETYIQSGNVLFETRAGDEERLRARIENVIEEAFGFDVVVMVRSADEIRAVANHPALSSDRPDRPAYVSFLHAPLLPAGQAALAALNSATEKHTVHGRDIISSLSRQPDGRTQFGNLENLLGVPVTMRNAKTVFKLRELADARAD